MTATQTTIEIRGDASSLRKEMDDAITSLRQFGTTVDVTSKTARDAFRTAAEDTRGLTSALKATELQSAQLEKVIAATESRIDSIDRRTGMATERMARGFQFVAKTGDMAGRGMATVLASASDLAFAFGPEGAVIGSIAIAGLALTDFFNKAAKDAEKAQKKIDDFAEHIARSGDPSKMQGVATGSRSTVKDLQEQIDAKQKELDGWIAINQSSGADEVSRSEVARLTTGIAALERTKKAAEGWAQTLEASAKNVKTTMDLEIQVDQVRTDLMTKRAEVLQKERELQKEQAAGHLFVVQALTGQLANLESSMNATEAKLRGLIAWNADILGMNAVRETKQLDHGDQQFADARRTITRRDPIDAAMRQEAAFDKTLDSVVAAIDKQTDKQSVFQQREAADRLSMVAGFGKVGEGIFTGAQTDKFVDAWKKGLADARKGPQTRGFNPMTPELQAQLDKNDEQSDKDRRFKNLIPDIAGLRPALLTARRDFKEASDDIIKNMKNVRSAGEMMYDALAAASKKGIDMIVQGHKLSVKEIKKALAEPIVAALEMDAIKYADKSLGYFSDGNVVQGALAAAASLAFTAGAALVGSIGGTGGGGGGGASGGGGGGSGSNTGSALARGAQNQSGPQTMEIIITQKAPDGRTVARTKQMLQRLDDRNQPARVTL